MDFNRSNPTLPLNERSQRGNAIKRRRLSDEAILRNPSSITRPAGDTGSLVRRTSVNDGVLRITTTRHSPAQWSELG